MRPLIAWQSCGGRKTVIGAIRDDVKVNIVGAARAHRSKVVGGGLGINDAAEDRTCRIDPGLHRKTVGGKVAEKARNSAHNLVIGPVKMEGIPHLSSENGKRKQETEQQRVETFHRM